jgi:uncharacterized protein (TIGR02466 family)
VTELMCLFPVPILRTNLDINCGEIIEHTKNLSFLGPSKDPASNLLFISEDTNVLNLKHNTSLKEQIIININYYLQEILKIDLTNIDPYVLNSWVIKVSPGGYGPRHQHSLSAFTGTFYVDVDEKSSPITFYKKHNNVTFDFMSPALMLNEYNFINSSSWSINLQKNDLILFPSNLDHQIGFNDSNNDRYSIAFDIFFKGTFDKGFTGNLNFY